MKQRQIALETISTELPTKCGIATFNGNFVKWALEDPRIIWNRHNALVKTHSEYPMDYRDNVFEIFQGNKESQNQSIERIIKNHKMWEAENKGRSKKGKQPIDHGVVVQFEYGIYDGDFLTRMLKAFSENNVTNILIPHTILEDPENPGQYINDPKDDLVKLREGGVI